MIDHCPTNISPPPSNLVWVARSCSNWVELQTSVSGFFPQVLCETSNSLHLKVMAVTRGTSLVSAWQDSFFIFFFLPLSFPPPQRRTCNHGSIMGAGWESVRTFILDGKWIFWPSRKPIYLHNNSPCGGSMHLTGRCLQPATWNYGVLVRANAPVSEWVALWLVSRCYV